jgi:enolase
VANVNSILNPRLSGEDAADQARVDRRMREADGTPDKRKLGANATLAVSLASARAA